MNWESFIIGFAVGCLATGLIAALLIHRMSMKFIETSVSVIGDGLRDINKGYKK